MTSNSTFSCKILVPVYKNRLSHNEALVIKNLLKFYEDSLISIICPEELEIPTQLTHLKSEKFSKSYFKNIDGYNKLLLSEELYTRFEKFDFILIHQLDAFIFKDELEYWCKQNYDYIGAPWLRDERFVANLFRSKKIKDRDVIFNKVGNGGFSLRKTETFLDFIINHKDIIKKNTSHKLYGIEDVFWSIIAPQHMPFKIPNVAEAAKFALDRKPDLGMQLNNFNLPFGCHGFEKNKTKPFWKKHIKGLT